MVSDLDKTLALYDLLKYIKPLDMRGPILFHNITQFVIYPDATLKKFLRDLEAWNWIELAENYDVMALTRPAENIYLRPRPIQEVYS